MGGGGGGRPGPTPKFNQVSDTMCVLFRPSQLDQPLCCSQVEYVTGASLMWYGRDPWFCVDLLTAVIDAVAWTNTHLVCSTCKNCCLGPKSTSGWFFFLLIRVIHKVTLSLGMLSPPIPTFSDIRKVRKFY